MAVIKAFKNIKSLPVTATTGRFNVTQTQLGQNFFGDLRIGDKGGGASLRIEGSNNRIIINDGVNDRVLIGHDEGGF